VRSDRDFFKRLTLYTEARGFGEKV
jgi:hypothetical protein